MSTQRPVRSGALLEMAGVTIVWAVLLFAVVFTAIVVLSAMFAQQIGDVLGIFGIAPH